MKTIKKFWFVIFTSLFVFTSCDLLSNLTKDVDIDAPDVEFHVAGSAASVKSKVNGVANSETPVVLLNRKVNLNITEEVKNTVNLDLNVVKALRLKSALVTTTTNDFNLNELSGLKMYFGEEATDANLVAKVSSVGANSVILEILSPDVYNKLGTDESINIIITNPQALTLPSVDLILSAKYTVTIGL